MTPSEFNALIINTPDYDVLSEIEYTYSFPYIGISVKIKGLVEIYKYAYNQFEGWNSMENRPPAYDNSLNYFSKIISFLKDNFAQNANRNVELYQIWSSYSNQNFNQNKSNVLTFDSPYVKFLNEVFLNNEDSFMGAFDMIVEKFPQNNLSSLGQKYFVGGIFAYEFKYSGKNISSRSSVEIKSIQNLKTSLESFIYDSDKRVNLIIDERNKSIDSLTIKFQNLIISKETEFQEWLDNTSRLHEVQQIEYKEKIAEMERTYEEKLRLSKPAEYWHKRALEMNEKGKTYLKWLIGLTLFAAISLFCLLWLGPEGMLLNFITGDLKALKWSIVYISFLSFIAFGLRAFYKVTFSYFHLARDAEEREQLTYVYLSMISGTKIDDSDRKLILQSLFSRVDTGLLKEDSSPTMPGSAWSKIINNN